MGETSRVRFGLFDFDPGTGELRREGLPVRLQSQPAQVLALLLAHPGEVVARETLRNAVWGTETFVDFDRGLNFCVAQIRSALGDSAESPRFVRTIPKRGYQFIAPVGPVAVSPSTEPLPPVALYSKRRLLKQALGVALVSTLILLGVRLWISRRAAATPAIRVAVLRFDNQTGNPDFDRFADQITDSVVADLTDAGAGRYGVIGNAAILRQPRDRRDLLAITSSLGVAYVVLGQIQKTPSGVQVLAHLIRVPEQTHLRVARMEVGTGDPSGAQSGLAHRIVADLSPRLASDSASNRASPVPVPH